MSQPDRRTLEELLARYDLEPGLPDVYVEGTFDREVLTRYFRCCHQRERIIYEIDTIEIPAETLEREGLGLGNKQRLIALARTLRGLQKEVACRCLVDKDLDHWFGPLEQNWALVWTKHCSIELYFWTDQLLRDLLLVAARVRIKDWWEFVDSMTVALLDLYAMRLADRELGWSMQWLPIRKHLKAVGDRVRFDSEEYVARLLMKNGRAGSAQSFITCLAKRRSALTGDPRDAVRGHDFTEILSWAIREFRGVKDLSSTVAVERIFLLAVPEVMELADLFPPLIRKKSLSITVTRD